jgi:hypothetical protein
MSNWNQLEFGKHKRNRVMKNFTNEQANIMYETLVRVKKLTKKETSIVAWVSQEWYDEFMKELKKYVHKDTSFTKREQWKN